MADVEIILTEEEVDDLLTGLYVAENECVLDSDRVKALADHITFDCKHLRRD